VPLAGEERIAELARLAGDRFRGLHFYDGQDHGSDARARRASAHAGYARLVRIASSLVGRGLPVGEIVTSGTPSFLHAAQYEPLRTIEGTVHRMSPGTVVYHDLRTEREITELDLRPAALVLSRVVSLPSPGIATCDAGSKSIAAEAGDPCAFVVGRPGLRALRPSEEHLPLAIDAGPAPRRGELLWLVPRHVCPTVNLAEDAVLVDEGQHCRIVSVGARAHDVIPAG
jgi:D-serine deaminase-like pyridoxal phosphate-dependent protein